MPPRLGLLACILLINSTAFAQSQGQQQSDMQAGGLAPPPSVGNDPFAPPQSQTEQELERAEREDAGRGLEFFWINGEIGFEHLGLQTFRANDLVDAEVVKSTQTGPLYGGGIGFRLVFITLGGRFRYATFSDFELWTLDAEVGMRIPLGALEPYFTFAGGYASLGSFSSENIGANLNDAGVDITGFNLRIGGGLDVYLSEMFSIGANVTGEMLFLSRPGVDLADMPAEPTVEAVYEKDGSSIGAGLSVTGVIGLHF
jgi:hypothetical protein